MSEQKTGFSKRFAIEIDTGETETRRRGQGRGREVTTPVTQRFPPDRTKSLRTKTTYTKDDSTGRLTDPNVEVYQEITKEQWDQLPDSVRDSQAGIGGRGARPGRTVYYGKIAEIPAGKRDYVTSSFSDTEGGEERTVIDVLYPGNNGEESDNAKLLKEEIGKYKNREGQFRTVSRVANVTVLKNEDIDTNTPDSKDQLGLGSDGPEDIVDNDANNIISKPIPFDVADFREGTNKGFEDLRYPDKLKAELQDVIKFTQVIYGTRSFSKENVGKSTPKVIGFAKRDLNKTIKGSVTLPIQDQITDTNMVDWTNDQMNPLQAFASAGLMGMDRKTVAGTVNNLLDTAKKLAVDDEISGPLGTAVKAYLIQEAVGTQNLLSRATGSIANPNIELLFRSPQLRPFSFSFFLAARDDNDARQIKQIIRFFKQGMSVKDPATDIFLRAPNVFRIQYLHEGGPHPGLNQIKECALTNCSVQYTPANTYSTFEDGTMTAYRIILQFTELTPVTEADYNKDDVTPIGY